MWSCRQLIVSWALLGLMAASTRADDLVLPGQFEAVPTPDKINLTVNFTFAPDGTAFLVRKDGWVRALRPDGSAQALAVLDLRDEVNISGDRGLLGVALHPGFVPDGGPNSWIYLMYTAAPVLGVDLAWGEDDQHQWGRVTRYKIVPSGPNLVADPASRHVLLGERLPDGSVPTGIANLHNSHSNGTLAFADDGTLIVTTGDGSANFADHGGQYPAGFDNWTHPVTGLRGPIPAVQDSGQFRAQDLRSLSGKVLRLDPETGMGLPSNPFWDGDGNSNASRVWTLGIRNAYHVALLPGTGALDPALGEPNVMVVGDVGWISWEEINVVTHGGMNLGWPCYEGHPEVPVSQAFDPANPAFPNCHTPIEGILTGPKVTWHHHDASLFTPPGTYFEANGDPSVGFKGVCALGGAQYIGGDYPDEYDGVMFFGDFAGGLLKTLKMDANYNVVEVRAFAEGLHRVTDIERHPITGNIWWVDLDSQQLHELRWVENKSPLAVIEASETIGNAPLEVSFTGSLSSDPEDGPLLYLWDFGDGSPTRDRPDPIHAYTADGSYLASLTVTDDFGHTAFASIDISVGVDAPVVQIDTPVQGQEFDPPALITLSGSATDPDGPAPELEWTVDLAHNGHVHPSEFTSTSSTFQFVAGDSHGDGDLNFYRVELAATDAQGLTTREHVYVFPAADVDDVTGTARMISRLDELSPPISLGTGNPDPEVMRDNAFAAPGATDPMLQFDTAHGGDQGADDWIGYELTEEPDVSVHFAGLTFQEGLHGADGGWWEDFAVEVRHDGEWHEVDGLVVDPPYPFELADEPSFDGVPFDSYTLRFDPTHGDAVRLRGTPGGAAGYISCAELRARVIQKRPILTHRDISSEATIIAAIDELVPPGPLGAGNSSIETIRNGTWPQVGSASLLAQFDTFHDGDQLGEDWIGYDFAWPRTLDRVVFQEGAHYLTPPWAGTGGAFDDLRVEMQAGPGDPWVAVTGLSVSPPYPGGVDAFSYETYTLDFDDTTGVAVRLIGTPSGSDKFISVGELRVFEPGLPVGCGWSSYGEGLGGANTLSLYSPSVPAAGLQVLLVAEGASPFVPGLLAFGLGQAAAPFRGGTLLVDPSGIFLVNFAFDDDGKLVTSVNLGNDPSAQGIPVFMQTFALDSMTWMSNGLELVICDLP